MTTVPVPPVTVGEVGQEGPAFQHGTLSMYQIGGCRCEECKAVKAKQRQRGKVRTQLTGDQARFCQVCGVRIQEHPFVACWRGLR